MNTKDTTYYVLLVDDEESVIRALQHTLRRQNYQIHAFTDPKIALLEAEKQNFDLVISDYRMPVMDGVQFLHKLIAIQPQIKRIMLSGYADLRAVMAAINEVGVLKFLTKPWKDDELQEIVATALKQKLSSQPEFSQSAAVVEQNKGALAQLEALYPGITEGVWSEDDARRWQPKTGTGTRFNNH